MENITIQYHKTPYGELLLGSVKDKLCICDWRYRKMRTMIDKRVTKGLQAAFLEKDTEVLDKTRQQLDEYFNYKRKSFDVPLLFVGTDFQKRVWHELEKIPFGSTVTYMELAEKTGDTSAIRAVASANGANAISIIIPCHRIIGSDGKLVGYAGGLPAKAKLLKHEQSLFSH